MLPYSASGSSDFEHHFVALADTNFAVFGWDVQHYKVSVTPNYLSKCIKGTNGISFKAVTAGSVMKLELQQPMLISKVVFQRRELKFKRISDDGYSITFPATLTKGKLHLVEVSFEGKPKEALNPPVDNGWIWTKDTQGRPWVSVACEGSGASIWLPCKDELRDKPDQGATISITVPDTLMAVSNGRLLKKVSNNGLTTFTWNVTNPINSYNIIPYIGKYVTWRKTFYGEGGLLHRDYWVLDYNLKKGKVHFMQTDTMFRAFENWLGKYPFYADSYKLVEAPLPGMEHQSAVAYGNGFQNGYQGKDFISRSGWGLKWDFMMVHESGHEWFGNSVTAASYGETWIHEGFTKYLETLYTDYAFGSQAGNEYAIGTWRRIKNDEPILGTNTSDKYYKGSAMLHMVRQIIGDDVFKGWLRALNQQYIHKVVNTSQVLSHLNKYTHRDFARLFKQYLQTTKIPVLQYRYTKDVLEFRWSNCVDGFNMPLKTHIGKNKSLWLYPSTQWQSIKSSSGSLTPSVNFLIGVEALK
ncbi:M1 family metallopeptidase [Mucilaginibacter sp. CSA2-8R]|uniref:M1 family metallopeptidase n=1 Tax=Mucilaginibacter sp. CSA2-8R TaxID=3141542 RepID=UPI00315C6AD2